MVYELQSRLGASCTAERKLRDGKRNHADETMFKPKILGVCVPAAKRSTIPVMPEKPVHQPLSCRESRELSGVQSKDADVALHPLAGYALRHTLPH